MRAGIVSPDVAALEASAVFASGKYFNVRGLAGELRNQITVHAMRLENPWLMIINKIIAAAGVHGVWAWR